MRDKPQAPLILSTGGTFNKRYDPVAGELQVDGSASALQEIAAAWQVEWDVVTLIGKDSLEMNDADRSLLVETIRAHPRRPILIVHGTDTMDRSAELLARELPERLIVFTGAMVPYAVDPVEATANLASAWCYLSHPHTKPGIYIAMHGRVLPHHRIYKDRRLGRFLPKP